MTNRDDTLYTWDRIMAAISFAETGEAETAVAIMNQGATEIFSKQRGLQVETRKSMRPELRI